MPRFFGSVLLLLMTVACAHSTIIPFQPKAQAPVSYPATAPGEIGVYRVQRPFDSFDEIGLITFRSTRLDLPLIYDVLRADAAPHGAEAIVDLKIKSETYQDTEMNRVCVPETVCDGSSCETRDVCHDELVPVTRTTFFTEGSMIRRKK